MIDLPHLEATQIDVDIDASSVDTAMAVRDAHLRGEEFFDIERHPKISSAPGVRPCWRRIAP